MNVVVTGELGRLGSELVQQGCTPFGCVDISKEELVTQCFENTKPEVLINCAGFTLVDYAEQDNIYQGQVIPANVTGPIRLAWACQDRKIPFIHLSSDYVFGDDEGPYKEVQFDLDVNTAPGGAYASSKLSAEIVLQEFSGVTIVRTTGLYGTRKDDFVGHTIRELREGRKLDVTKELHGNQTYIPHLAEALIKLAQLENKPQLIHLASREVITRYEFALMIASVFGYDKMLINPVKNNQVPGWKAKRPTKAGLKIKLADRLGLPIYTILEGLKALHEN